MCECRGAIERVAACGHRTWHMFCLFLSPALFLLLTSCVMYCLNLHGFHHNQQDFHTVMRVK